MIASLGSLLSCALPVRSADGQPLTLTYEETISAPLRDTTRSPVVYVISPERTIIRRNGEETVVDYQTLALVRRREGSSIEYPLNPPGTGQKLSPSLQDNLMRRIAAYRLANPKAGLVIRGLPTVERSIWFGVSPALSLTAMPLSVEYFGQVFTERRIQCWVSQGTRTYGTMAEIARSRRAVVRANPLLLQVDPTNLILPLEGLPIRLREQRDEALHLLELISP